MAQLDLQKNPRSTLYHCCQHLLHALLTEAEDAEKQALYKTLEWLGISQIRSMNANAADLESPGVSNSQPSDIKHIN
jgi:hypothetical protein